MVSVRLYIFLDYRLSISRHQRGDICDFSLNGWLNKVEEHGFDVVGHSLKMSGCGYGFCRLSGPRDPNGSACMTSAKSSKFEAYHSYINRKLCFWIMAPRV